MSHAGRFQQKAIAGHAKDQATGVPAAGDQAFVNGFFGLRFVHMKPLGVELSGEVQNFGFSDRVRAHDLDIADMKVFPANFETWCGL